MNGMTPRQAQAWALRQAGHMPVEIAAMMGGHETRTTVSLLLRRARKWADMDPHTALTLSDMGIEDPSKVHSGWLKQSDENGNGASIYFYHGKDQERIDLRAAVEESISQAFAGRAPEFPQRPPVEGGNLLVVDLADLHFGKLSVASETGETYNRDVAKHRTIEGVRRLLALAMPFGIGRILFVLGNDMLHIDTPGGTTTSGTKVDTEGSLHQMYVDCADAMREAITICAKVADVDLVYVPSNHDWVMGWTLSREIAAWFHNHPHVTMTDYALSPAHRKYYRYERNLIGLTHGDGAKESDLYALMMTEARAHASECDRRYWYLHHFHHRIKKRQGVSPQDMAKDHIGMTVVSTGIGKLPEDIQIQYVRSPSAPDGWHHRNGFINRQAVEAFIHSPTEGQFASFTAYF